MTQRVYILLLFVGMSLNAQTLNLAFFDDKPKSLTKDFYISQFLDQGISKSQAQALLPQVKNLNPKLFRKFAKHIDKFKRKSYCQNLKEEQFLGVDESCVKQGLSLYKATKLSPSLLEKIAFNIKRQNPVLATKYLAIATKKFDNLHKLPPKLLCETFNNVGGKFRLEHYDKPLAKTLIYALVEEKSFNIMIEKIVRGDFPNLQKSLIDIPSTSLTAESNFLLALNALRANQTELALRYLSHAEAKAPFTFEKDKALFWKYLITKESSILQLLKNSHEINIYSLRAYELLNEFPTNIMSTILPKTTNNIIDITNPFAWINFKSKVKAMKFTNYQEKKSWLMQYNTPDMEPHISRLLYRYKNNIHYYLTPYKKHLEQTPIERQILIYALARQESYFIPTEVSYSYALGMMQFMPFVAKDIAKQHKFTDFQYEDMFKPKTAYKFANIHLDFLEKSVKHPLFIAYAYNAGIGFTKRKILSKEYFKTGFYEPFWSLEMVPNSQARKYGKRVLANYAIYAKQLGLGITLNNLLQTIK